MSYGDVLHATWQPQVGLLAPTRQHKGWVVKRGGDVLHLDAWEPAEAHGGGIELLAVARGRSWARLGMGHY